MKYITIDMDALAKAIDSNTDANEQEARSIINTVLYSAPKEPPGWKNTAYGWAQSGESILAEEQAKGAPVPASVQGTGLTLPKRIAELIEQHGSLRAAARVIDCDPGYLSRLQSGEKDDPGNHLLRRIGLRQIVTYERIKP